MRRHRGRARCSQPMFSLPHRSLREGPRIRQAWPRRLADRGLLQAADRSRLIRWRMGAHPAKPPFGFASVEVSISESPLLAGLPLSALNRAALSLESFFRPFRRPQCVRRSPRADPCRAAQGHDALLGNGTAPRGCSSGVRPMECHWYIPVRDLLTPTWCCTIERPVMHKAHNVH